MSKIRQYPIMHKATAVWLVDNTALTFKQIADFCGMHELEVQGIADGEVANGIIGIDPVINGQLELHEIERCSKDPNAKLQLKVNSVYEALEKNRKKKRNNYTPIARRQDKPDAIFWLLKNVPNIKDSTIIRLIGTTKTTITAIRDRSHWNISNIRQRDPVLLGICTQIDLDRTIEEYRLPDNNQESDSDLTKAKPIIEN